MTDDSRQPGVLRVLTTRAETRAFYDKISRVYDHLAERSEAPVRQAGLRLLGAAAGQRVLEVGCGTGSSLIEINRKVGDSGTVHGLDLSAGMLAQARRRLVAAGAACCLVQGEAAALPYAGAAFDAVFLSFTLELFDQPEIPTVLGECLRVLRPGGRLVVVGMSKEGKQGLVVQAFEWTHRHFPNFLDCRPIFVRRAVEAAGFKVERSLHRRMWVPVEVVAALRPGPGAGGGGSGETR